MKFDFENVPKHSDTQEVTCRMNSFGNIEVYRQDRFGNSQCICVLRIKNDPEVAAKILHETFGFWVPTKFQPTCSDMELFRSLRRMNVERIYATDHHSPENAPNEFRCWPRCKTQGDCWYVRNQMSQGLCEYLNVNRKLMLSDLEAL